MERDVFKQGNALCERNALIKLPEKAGIVKAGSQNALVSVADDVLASVRGRGVEDCEEVRCEIACGILNGEVILVVPHNRNKDFLREFQVLGVEAAGDD